MKLHVNSSISDAKSRFVCMDVIDFYLNNMMYRAKYIMIHIVMIPPNFLDKYNLQLKAHNGYICARVTKGMYGLPLSGQIAHDALVKHLEIYGYHP